MSDRLTSCEPRPGVGPERALYGSGVAAWGRLTRAEAIAQFRHHHQWRLEMAQAALALADEDLIVETYLGPNAMRNREEVAE